MTEMAVQRDPDDRFEAVNPAYPRSWWIVAYSTDVRAERVIPARILERDLIIWRDEHGAVHCMNAHCPHLGVNIGMGGDVCGGRVRCPFHGWEFDETGLLRGKPGPDPLRRNLRITTYRVIERYGAIFLWNGAGAPDIEFPDILGQAGIDDDDIVFCHHRWQLPFPAKLFAENVADGMHLAVAHDTGGWGETKIGEQTETMARFDHVFHDTRPWWSWTNLRRRAKKRELTNMIAAATSNFSISTFGATIQAIEFSDRSESYGRAIFCWTPVEVDSHCFFEMAIVPRIRVPLVSGALHRVVDAAIEWANWTVLRQDISLMMGRHEGVKPPYSANDRGLVAYRRLWDSRIDSDRPLDGDNVRHYGTRAGISQPRVGAAERDSAEHVSNDAVAAPGPRRIQQTETVL